MRDRDTKDRKAPAEPRDPEQLLLGGDGQQYSVAELRARVTLAEPGITVLRELPVGAPETLIAMTQRARELAEPYENWAMVVDLVDSAGLLPSGYRTFIPEHLGTLGVTHVGIALYTNPVVRGVAKFVGCGSFATIAFRSLDAPKVAPSGERIRDRIAIVS